jgi:lysophospholipase L1-like esterase
LTKKSSHDKTRIVILGASYARGWSPSHPQVEFVNRGGDGQQSWELLARFERDVLGEQPDAVIIWGFINDIFRAPKGTTDAALERARSSMAAMIDLAIQSRVEPILATEVPIRGRGGWKDAVGLMMAPFMGKVSYQDRVNQQVREVNGWLRATAVERDLLLLDLYEAVVDRRGQRKKAYAAADGSHIPKAGYDALSKLAERALTTRLARNTE